MVHIWYTHSKIGTEMVQSQIKKRFIFDRRKTASNETKGSVEIEVTLNGKRKRYATGVNVFIDQWDERYKVVNSFESGSLNKSLDTLMSDLGRYEELNQPISIGKIDLFFNQKSEDGSFIEFVSNLILNRKDLRKGTIRTHKSLLESLKEFKRINYYDDLTLPNIDAYDKFLHNKGYLQTTVWGYHKRLKRYINEALRLGKIRDNPYNRFKVNRGKPSGRRYLIKDELDKLEKAKFTSESLSKVRDLAVVQAYTGLAFSDFMKTDFSKAEKMGEDYIIRDTRIKTDEQYFIVLLKPAVRILEKYGWELPKMSNTCYNLRLQVIASKLGFDEKMSSHWLRRTFAVLMLSMGAKMENVAKMLGHSDIKITQEYAKILALDVKNDYDMINEKLK